MTKNLTMKFNEKQDMISKIILNNYIEFKLIIIEKALLKLT